MTKQIALQPTSQEIWATKYQLKAANGDPVDKNIKHTFVRVAGALSKVEPTLDEQNYWYEQFLWALENGALPAGRILSNAGAGNHKPSASLINCTVSGTIPDSMDGILDMNKEAGMTLKAGCGIGYEFSTLRPKGAYVAGAGAQTSGPLSFMDIFDKTCFTVSSAGGRRGAQMATFDIRHPDVVEFIKAKREDGRLRQFNLSLLITSEFIEAVKENKEWHFYFPLTSQLNANTLHSSMPARNLWNLIMAATYDYAEPGFILIDKVNEMNNNWFCEDIRATNPCGEQPLPPHGSCLLGSVNLTKFVLDPFTDAARFDRAKYEKVIRIFTRMLDNVVELNNLPLPEQREEILRKRRHGMGFLGLGSAIAMMGYTYGDGDSIRFTENVAKTMAHIGWQEALALAKEKGCAPIMQETFIVTKEMLLKRPEMVDDEWDIGDELTGAYLHTKYSRYMQQLAEVDPMLINNLSKYGARFTHHTSIAPTGTISLSLANNASNGIEPSFAHHYSRNVIKQGKKTKEKVNVFSYELLAYRELINPDAMPEDLPANCITADQVTPKQHIDIQAAAQKWIDSSISKTANVPTDYPYEDFKDIYMYAYEKGLKGCTTFRFNPEAFQGVLVKEVDLENTVYEFTFEDGSVIDFKGNEEIEYDGETHTAANLFDALKEGYYGKL